MVMNTHLTLHNIIGCSEQAAQLTSLVLQWPHEQAKERSSRRWRCAAQPPAFAKRITGTVQNNASAGAQEPLVRYMIPCIGP